jgi:hypothetical protein
MKDLGDATLPMGNCELSLFCDEKGVTESEEE